MLKRWKNIPEKTIFTINAMTMPNKGVKRG
jgi:hypothetical protein